MLGLLLQIFEALRVAIGLKGRLIQELYKGLQVLGFQGMGFGGFSGSEGHNHPFMKGRQCGEGSSVKVFRDFSALRFSSGL